MHTVESELTGCERHPRVFVVEPIGSLARFNKPFVQTIDINRGIADSEWRENMFEFRSALTGSHRKSKPWTLTVPTVATWQWIQYQFKNFRMYLR